MIWDGTSKTRTNPNVIRAPDGWDYARAIAEIQKLQREVYATAFQNIPSYRFVRLRFDGQVELSDFNISGNVIGMSLSKTLIGQLTPISFFGVIVLSNWTQTAGTATLTPDADYYLSSEGKMTIVSPTTGFFVKVGKALCSSDFLIRLEPSIKL